MGNLEPVLGSDDTIRRNFSKLEDLIDSVTALTAAFATALDGNRFVRGIVSGAGAIEEGTGFTVVRNSTGNYTVTFSPAFADVPTVIPAIGTSATANYVRISSATAVTASAVLILAFTFAGAAADAQFHFTAVGP